MSNWFTDDELQARISTLLTSTAVPRDNLGVVQTDRKSEAVRRAAVNAFLADPGLIYSAAATAVGLLSAELVGCTETVASIRALVRATMKIVAPVTDLAPLSAATSAITALDTVGTQHRALHESDAYRQFNTQSATHLRRHLSSLTNNGTVSPAPLESKRQIAELWFSLQAKVLDVYSRAGKLSLASESLSAASLPSAASSLTVAAVRRSLASLQAKLLDQTPTERLGTLREDCLALVAARAALRAVASLPEATSVLSSGAAATVIDSEHSGERAQADGLPGPYEVNALLPLTTQLGTGPERSIYLPTSSAPLFTGTRFEIYGASSTINTGNGPFTIASGTRELQIYLKKVDGGVVDGGLLLTTGSRTAAQVAAEVQSYWDDLGVGATFTATVSGLAVHFAAAGGATLLMGSGTANTPLGLTPAGGFVVQDKQPAVILGSVAGPFTITLDTNDLLLFFLRDQSGQLLQVQVKLAAGSRTTHSILTEVQDAIDALGQGAPRYGLFSDSGRVKIASSEGSGYELRMGSGTANAVLGFTTGTTSVGVDSNLELDVTLNGSPLPTVTLPAGVYSGSTLASMLATSLGSGWAVTSAGAAGSKYLVLRYVAAGSSSATVKLPASGLASYFGWLIDTESSGRGLSAADMTTKLKELLVDAVPSCVFSGSTVTRSVQGRAGSTLVFYTETGEAALTVPAAHTIRLGVATTLSVGDKVLLEDGSLWTISSKSSGYFEATSGVSRDPAPSIRYWGGADPGLLVGSRARVTGALFGAYTVDAITSLLEARVSPPPAAGLTGEATLGAEAVRLTAGADKTLTLGGAGAVLLFGAELELAQKTTWIQAPTVRRPEPGDLFDIYATSYSTPSSQLVVRQVVDTYLRLDAPLAHPQSWPSSGSPPFARVRSYKAALLEDLEQGLGAALSAQLDLRAIDEVLQRLMAHQGPTPPALVLTVLGQLDTLSAWLATVASTLSVYRVKATPAWDKLTRLLRQQGADKGLDSLEQCDFTAFFQDPCRSYSGHLSDSLSQAIRTQTPVDNRTQRGRSEVRHQAFGDDPENSFEDVEHPQTPSGSGAVGATPKTSLG